MKLSQYIHTLAVIFLLLPVTIIAGDDSEENIIQGLVWLDMADPIKDANLAITKGDTRLRAVHGRRLIIPGVKNNSFHQYRKQYGINIIEGTSNDIFSEEHQRLNTLARDYAKKYNRIIMKK